MRVVPLQGLEPGDLDDHDGIAVDTQSSSDVGPLRKRPAVLGEHGRTHDLRAEVRIHRGRRARGEAAVANDHVRDCQPGPALEPVTPGDHIVKPEDQRQPGLAHDGAENRLGPRRMAYDDLEPGPRQHRSQCATRAGYGPRPARPNPAEVVNAGAGADQVAPQAALEAKRELALDRARPLRDHRQRLLDAAVEVAAIDLERSHLTVYAGHVAIHGDRVAAHSLSVEVFQGGHPGVGAEPGPQAPVTDGRSERPGQILDVRLAQDGVLTVPQELGDAAPSARDHGPAASHGPRDYETGAR